MTFIPDIQIETRAAELWQRWKLAPGFDVERLLDDLELRHVWDEIPDEDGGVVLGQLVPAKRLVILNERHLARLEAKGGRQLRYTVGHEIGHWVLHAPNPDAQAFVHDGRTWCRDGSADPQERQAEKFSAALLMPRDLLRNALPDSPWRGWSIVYHLADEFGVNITPMTIRLTDLKWMHEDANGDAVSGPAPAPGQGALFG